MTRNISNVTIGNKTQTQSFTATNWRATLGEFYSTSPLTTLSRIKQPVTLTATCYSVNYSRYCTLSYTAAIETTSTSYLTRSSTSGTSYLTRSSTSGYSGVSSSSKQTTTSGWY